MIHVYYGNGKGKTTAAIGLCARAAGCGFEAVFARFLKSWDCGEVHSLKKLGVLVVDARPEGASFVPDLSEQQFAATSDNCREAFETAASRDKENGVIVLDEVLDAVSAGLLDKQRVLAFLGKAKAEVVITGHTQIPEIFELADYLTHVVSERHPYEKGILARRGIEF
ncbi:MAG: cob(I)yrinic acid a,c-diamide adenosyltransferase [Oscillospiraceae bacterium]|jgi:cob(I)alamin adenosyltransferase|nr:cob(I)yrinic acid a,c-diamide adenosyltransferase [Oscillospiraceae bacterium]